MNHFQPISIPNDHIFPGTARNDHTVPFHGYPVSLHSPPHQKLVQPDLTRAFRLNSLPVQCDRHGRCLEYQSRPKRLSAKISRGKEDVPVALCQQHDRVSDRSRSRRGFRQKGFCVFQILNRMCEAFESSRVLSIQAACNDASFHRWVRSAIAVGQDLTRSITWAETELEKGWQQHKEHLQCCGRDRPREQKL